MHIVSRRAVALALAACVSALTGASTHALASSGGEIPASAPAQEVQPVDASIAVGDTERLLQPLSNGCARVPSSGYIYQDEAARTSGTQYSNYWSWSGGSASGSFKWFIYTGSGTLKASGTSSGAGGSRSVSYANHYWKVKNLSALGQYWTVCWSD